jgi:hypothetical protein
MALNQSLAQLRASVRKFANVQGTTATLRHPDADINDYVLRAIGSLYRRLTEAVPDQRYLDSATITTSSGISTYSLPAGFASLISIDMTALGMKVWLNAYEMPERPGLTDPATTFTGVPYSYRLRQSNIEYLPVPGGAYTSTLWYVPDAQQPVEGQSFDTISRLDDYLVAYASRIVATKDKNWDLVGECRNVCGELDADITALGRNRDQNSPGRITDVYAFNRYGRRSWGPRRFR